MTNSNQQGFRSGVVEGVPIFETRDIDFVAFLLSQETLHVLPRGVGEAAQPFQIMPVRLAEMRPFMDKDTKDPERGVRYVFLLQAEDSDVAETSFVETLASLELLFLNKRALVEPIGFGAWRRQLRAWMTETDSRRKKFLNDRKTTKE